MANYTLQLDLVGADKTEGQLDSLLKKVNDIGSGSPVSLMEHLGAGVDELRELEGQSGNAGTKAGKSFANSFGGGIKQILNGPNFMKELETQLDDLFKVAPEAKLEAMRKKADLAFQNIQEKEAAAREKAISKREEFELQGRNKIAMMPEITSLIKEAVIPWKKIGMAELYGKQKIAVPETPAWMNKKFFEKVPEPPRQAGFKDYAIAGLATLFNPFIGARAFENIEKAKKGGGGGGAALLGSESYVEKFVMVKAVEIAITSLVNAIKRTAKAYDDARNLYAKTIMGGLGTGFTAKRSMLADILGVDEKEVMRFGAALSYLNPKLEFATEQITKTNQALTQVGWEFKIVEKNLQAIWAVAANALAPAFQSMLENFNSFVVALGKTGAIEALAGAINVVGVVISDIVGLIEVAVAGLANGMNILGGIIDIIIMKIENLVSKIPGLGFLGGNDTGAVWDNMIQGSESVANLAQSVFDNFLGGGDKNKVPTPQSYMKQMPASTFEKMGLIVGGGTNTTNDLIKKSNSLLQIIAKNTSVGSDAAGTFGMNPLNSNP